MQTLVKGNNRSGSTGSTHADTSTTQRLSFRARWWPPFKAALSIVDGGRECGALGPDRRLQLTIRPVVATAWPSIVRCVASVHGCPKPHAGSPPRTPPVAHAVVDLPGFARHAVLLEPVFELPENGSRQSSRNGSLN
jgi:hypothetical protein